MKKLTLFKFPPGKRSQRAQSMVEFALTLPILLLLVFGIIEFGRMLQAWLALENGARFAIRYAVTGNYDPTYCSEAAAALDGQLTAEFVLGEDYPAGQFVNFSTLDDDGAGNFDCRVSEALVVTQSWHTDNDKTKEEVELINSFLIDWARMPSIRAAALSGAMGLAYDPNEPVTGDYPAFLDHAYDIVGDTFEKTNRGTPQDPGYFDFTICSNRTYPSGDSYAFNPNLQYFTPNDPTELDQYRFLKYCSLVDTSSNFVRHIDDAGGPGNRVRVVLTYRHPLITPFVSTWWPTLRLTSEREGLVEKFRVSRVTGLVGSIGNAPLNTNTPLPTSTSTNTATATNTATSTATPSPCTLIGTGITGAYYQYRASDGPSFAEPKLTRTDLNINFAWYNPNSPDPSIGADYFAVRWTGKVIPYKPGDVYTFYTSSDDGARLYVDGAVIINNAWNDQSEKEFSSSQQITFDTCAPKTIVMEYYEKTGGAVARLKWSSSDVSKEIIPKANLIPDPGSILPTRTPTIPPTPTPEKCEWDGTGILGSYYEETAQPSFSILYQEKVQIDDNINFPWGYGSPNGIRTDNFAVRWTGNVIPKYPGVYTFYTYTDDGVRLYVDGNSIITGAWRDMGSTEYTSTTIDFTSCSPKTIVMEYYEHFGGAVAQLYWKSDMVPKEIIPKSNLQPSTGVATSTPTPVTPTNTPTPVTPTSTRTPVTPTSTRTPVTPTNTPTPVTPTATVPTRTPTPVTPTKTPTPVTPTNTPTPVTPTNTPTPVTPTNTPTPVTPTNTPTKTPIIFTDTPSPTFTPRPTFTPGSGD